jgi:hypothetical protein
MHHMDTSRSQAVNLAALTPPPVSNVGIGSGQGKKRKLGGNNGNRDSGNAYGDSGIDKGFDVADLGMGEGDEGDELLGMSDDQMVGIGTNIAKARS